MKSLVPYLVFGNRYCSIEHTVDADESTDIHILTATKKNGEFNIEKTFFNSSVETTATEIENNQHCFLNITGAQVLIKVTSTSGNDTKVIGSAFPNVDLDDFYYQILKTSTQSFVALCRKDLIHSILKAYTKNNIEVIGCSLSFFSFQHLINVIKEEEIQLANYSLLISNNEIQGYQKVRSGEEVKEYKIEDTFVQSNYLLPLAGLFSYDNPLPNIFSNLEELNEELRKEHFQKVVFRKGSLAGAGVLFLALLINFFTFSGYHTEIQNLEELNAAEISQKQLYEQKLSVIKEKEKQVRNILDNSGSKSSFFLNRIIAGKPSSIIFQEFIYQPIQRQIKDREPIILTNNVVKLSGESTDETEFSAWVKELEQITWVEGVKVSDFSYKSGQTSNFSIEIKIEQNEAGN